MRSLIMYSVLVLTKMKRCQSLIINYHSRFLPARDHFIRTVNPNSIFTTNPFCATFCTSTLHGPSDLFRSRESNENKNGVDIVSIENIKPSSPTPHHLRSYQVSLLDQYIHNIYIPFVYFFPNNNKLHQIHTTKQLLLLKQSLSQTLTRFYPFAGKVKDVRFIDCNDEGVYYVEANTKECMSDFLIRPDNKWMHKLLPFRPSSIELFSQSYVVMIQMTVFSCGGIAMGIYGSHKIIDGFTHATFLQAWASIARGSPEDIWPDFNASSVFLPDPAQDTEGLVEIIPHYLQHPKIVTKRFVFSSASLEILKKKAEASSRVVAVTGLIWRCVMDAAAASSGGSCMSDLMFAVDLRKRSSPPLPDYTIGNIVTLAIAQCSTDDYVSAGTLKSAVEKLKQATDSVTNSAYVEKMKGVEGAKNFKEIIDERKRLLSNKNAHRLLVTSMCNNGLYQLDFGWGKPIWVAAGAADSEFALAGNLVCLMDTGAGKSIEAWVMLPEGEMSIFESDTVLLSYAVLNPSPLQTIS